MSPTRPPRRPDRVHRERVRAGRQHGRRGLRHAPRHRAPPGRGRLHPVRLLGAASHRQPGPPPAQVHMGARLRIHGAPLEVRRLSKAFGGSRVVDDVSFAVEGGSFLTLLGPSGSGKTTTLRMLAVFEPPVLLMDEPLGALDKRLREDMQVELRHLQRELGITTVSVTHDQVEALVMSDVIAVLDGGRLQQVGPPLDVYRRPANQFVADFIGESNLLSGTLHTIDDAAIFTSGNGLRVRLAAAAAPPGPAHLVVRPEYVRLGPAAQGRANRYPAEVLEVLYVGDLVKYRLRIEQRDELVAKALAPSVDEPWKTGQQLTVGWDP